MKFLLDERRAREVESLLVPKMALDPHGDPTLGGGYRTTTLYCDTPDFEVFHGLGSHRWRKYRIRLYGDGTHVFVERKTRRGERVRKRRSTIASADLAQFSLERSREGWSGEWFHDELKSRRLRPCGLVQYQRTAYIGDSSEGPMRLTFDRNLVGAAASDWRLNFEASGTPILEGLVVCEFKFQWSLPSLFKSAIFELALVPTGISKYRRCIEMAAIAGHESRADV